MSRITKRAAARLLAATITGAVALTALTGCFMIPVLDGRSPFDDPFGVSTSQRDARIPELQAALDEIDTGTDWTLVARGGADNCEGACDLHLVAAITPTQALLKAELTRVEEHEEELPHGQDVIFLTVDIPPELWRETTSAALQTAEQAGIDVAIEAGFGERHLISDTEYALVPNECPAVIEHLGDLYDSFRTSDPDGRFTIDTNGRDTSCTVRFYPSKVPGIAESLNL